MKKKQDFSLKGVNLLKREGNLSSLDDEQIILGIISDQESFEHNNSSSQSLKDELFHQKSNLKAASILQEEQGYVDVYDDGLDYDFFEDERDLTDIFSDFDDSFYDEYDEELIINNDGNDIVINFYNSSVDDCHTDFNKSQLSTLAHIHAVYSDLDNEIYKKL